MKESEWSERARAPDAYISLLCVRPFAYSLAPTQATHSNLHTMDVMGCLNVLGIYYSVCIVVLFNLCFSCLFLRLLFFHFYAFAFVASCTRAEYTSEPLRSVLCIIWNEKLAYAGSFNTFSSSLFHSLSLSHTHCVAVCHFLPHLVPSLFSNDFKEKEKNFAHTKKTQIQQCQNNYKLFHNSKRHFHQKKFFFFVRKLGITLQCQKFWKMVRWKWRETVWKRGRGRAYFG